MVINNALARQTTQGENQEVLMVHQHLENEALYLSAVSTALRNLGEMEWKEADGKPLGIKVDVPAAIEGADIDDRPPQTIGLNEFFKKAGMTALRMKAQALMLRDQRLAKVAQAVADPAIAQVL